MKSIRSVFQTLKPALRIGLIAVVIGLFISYFAQNQESFETLRNIPAWKLSGVVVAQFIVIATNAVFLMIFLRAFKKTDAWSRVFDVTFNSSVVNFFGFLQGGVGVRGYYLKKEHKIAYREFGGLMAANYWAVFGISALLATLALLSQRSSVSTPSETTALVIFAGITLGLIVLVFVPKVFMPLAKKLSMERFFTGIDKLRTDRAFLAAMLGTGFAQFAASTAIYWLTLSGIGAAPSLSGLLIYSAIAQFSILIALTPSAIGFREGLLILAQDSMSVSTEEIVVSATAERLLYVIVLAAVGIYIKLRKRTISSSQDK